MAVYPDDIDTFRTIENLPGLTYNADDTKTLFAEDLEQIQSAVVAVENTLGTSPLWDYPNLSTALEEMTGRIAYLESYAIPLGVIMPYGGTTAPLNFMICNGAAISRTTYADLFALIGTTFGAGDGTTTFNIPDMRGNVPVGYKSGDANFGTLGLALGAAAVTLTLAQIPNATGSLGMHSAGSGTPIWTGSGVFATSTTAGQYRDGGTLNSGANSRAAVNFSLGGGGGSHPNIQPSLTVNYIIRVDV